MMIDAVSFEVVPSPLTRTSSNTILIQWDAPPSLDLTDVEPDIVYSVELYKITCGQNIFINHKVVFVNSTNNTVDPMEIYKVIITARSNVEGARNGNSVETRGIKITYVYFQ